MRSWSSQLVFLVFIAASCLGQRASVNVNANSGPPYDTRPFGKYLVQVCTLSRVPQTDAPFAPYLWTDVVCRRPLNPETPAQRANIQQKPQTITVKLVCDPTAKTPCDVTNPKMGDDFFVSATADSGLPVRQAVLLGSATPLGGFRTIHYRANSPGPVIIRATAPATAPYSAAAPVDLILQVSADSKSAADSCPVLPPSSGTPSAPLDTSTIVALVGNPTPFILAAEGSNTIFIYATRLPLQREEPRILGSFQQVIASLAGQTAASIGITPPPAKAFSVELKIPHASALGDLATQIGGLNYSQFTVQDVGRNWVRVTSPTQPDCETWKGFLTDIREMAWQLVSAPMSEKLFYLSSSDVATAFSGIASPAAAAAPAGSSASTGSTSNSSASTTPGASSTPSPTSSASAPAPTSTSTAPASNATIAITQPLGSNIQISSDTTPCLVAGLAFGNSSACTSTSAAVATPGASSASSAPSAAPGAAPARPAPLAMASVAVAAGTGEQTPPDLLVYSDTTPGDDAQIVERNRILAELDLPRPEMILSAWVTQNSSTNPQAMGAFNNTVKGIVADYNDEYEKVVLRAWLSLKEQQHHDKEYFNEPFRTYISDRFVADTNRERKTGANVQELSQAFLDQSQAKMADPISPIKRTNLGICERGRYCLGYTGLFSSSFLDIGKSEPDSPGPIKPALTDLLLAIIAAQNPVAVADKAITDVEGPAKSVPPYKQEDYCDNLGPLNSQAVNSDNDKEELYRKREESYKKVEARKRCHAIWRNLDLDHVSPPPQPASCEDLDFRGIFGSLFEGPPPPKTHLTTQQLELQSRLDSNFNEPRVHLQCFKQKAELLLASGASGCAQDNITCKLSALASLLPRIQINTTTHKIELIPDNTDKPSPDTPPYGVGLFRAAIADFLFNYKMSQQYPHEFVPYDLTQSANALNNALSPLIDAFNRDLWSYQMFVRADMQYQVEKLNSRNDERCCVKRLFGLDKPSFFNDGLVTVRTISGQATSVSTTSQSFLNGSTAPEVSALLSSLSGGTSASSAAGGTSAGASSTSNPNSGAGGPPSALGGNFGLIASALANYQTSFAQIGRQLSFSATPRSLATASSAEIAVTLNADESAGGPIYTGPGATDPAFNTSRVANHDTTTRVRVDSIKLFEVSSFSAIVERSRSRFPLLPPFVEIPYIGTFAGIPLGSAKEFHSSTAIISAYVVPTAADIAYGLHFVSDLAVDGLNPGPCSFFKGAAGPDVGNACLFRTMLSLRDVGPQQPIREFNKNITRCFATDTSSDGCRRVSFDNALDSHN